MTGGAPSPSLLPWTPRLTVRVRLTLSYAALLVAAGLVTAAVIYLVMRYVPDYPLTQANPGADPPVAPSRGEILDAVVRLSGLALLFLAVLGLVGGWFLAGRMLRPVQQITAAARLAAQGSLEHRIGLRGRRDEFTDLADTFDEMLDRLQRSFQAHQRFAANAAHELRTPQAITRTVLEVALADPDGQDVERLAGRLAEVNERSIHLVEALLGLAAIDGRAPVREPVDLATTARHVVEELRREADGAGVAVTAALGAAPVAGDPALLHQLVLNLAQNAVRHNLPRGGTVSVRTTSDEDGAQLVVVNSGEVIGPDEVATFAEPFVRRRGRIATADGGTRSHGLGLTIVAAIADVHDGTLRLAPNPEGGLTAQVVLPHP